MNEDTIKKLALVVAANCLSQDKSVQGIPSGAADFNDKVLKKQVANRLYTFLLYLLNKPSDEYVSLLSELSKNFPEDWETPELDAIFVQKATTHGQHPGSQQQLV